MSLDRPWWRLRTIPLALCLGAGLVVASCAPDPVYRSPSIHLTDRYLGASVGAPVLLSNDAWWRQLEDPELDQLISLALEESPNIAEAQARLTQARILVDAIGGAASGDVSADASVGLRGRVSLILRGAASWVFDPGGALRAERRGAGARADLASAELDAARLAIIAGVVETYLDLRYRQAILRLRREELSGRRDTLAAARQLLAAGSATRLDIVRAEALVVDLEAELPALEAAAHVAVSRLAVLVGRAPQELPPSLGAALVAEQPQPRAALPPDVGIPADLLRNRPDLRLAERRYYAAFVGVEAARAALYPRLSLNGSLSIDVLSNDHPSFIFGPTLQLPSIPNGPARASIEASEAGARAAIEAWRGAVLVALGEVDEALHEYQSASQAEVAARQAASLHREALELTRIVFEREEASLAEVIDAETAVAQAEARLAEVILRRSQAFAALNIRLGDGSTEMQHAMLN